MTSQKLPWWNCCALSEDYGNVGFGNLQCEAGGFLWRLRIEATDGTLIFTCWQTWSGWHSMSALQLVEIPVNAKLGSSSRLLLNWVIRGRSWWDSGRLLLSREDAQAQ